MPNFGDTSLCCINTGLSWYFTRQGVDYPENGGTAQIVSRLASGLVDSLTMTSPPTGTFTQAELNTANGSQVSLQDAQDITNHDEPSEDQWCFVPCESHPDQVACEENNCYWYNGNCYTDPPDCSVLSIQSECITYGCYWYNDGCHAEQPACGVLNNQPDCEAYSCFWYNGTCHADPPACEILSSEFDCDLFGCFWYRGSCHSADQPELCYWIDTKGGPTGLTIMDVFEIVDSFIFSTPPIGGWSFIPTIIEVFGIIDYFLGFNADPSTGCNYGG